MNWKPIKVACFSFIWGSLCVSLGYSQSTLDLDEAVKTGLEKNFSIRVAENEAQISANNNTLGNAGFLPVISADGSINQRNEDNLVRYADLPDRDDENAITTVYNYGINAGWRIFDGLTMFATLDRLSTEEKISEEEAQFRVELVLADIVTTYFQIAGQQKAYEVLLNTVEISQERINIAETKRQIGSGSEYELLQARADFNADRAALIRAGTIMNRSKYLLKRLMADSANVEYEVESGINLSEDLDLNMLIESAFEQNRELNIARLNANVATAEIREITGEWFPQIDVAGGYGYSRVEASSGFSEFSETAGLSYGITARVNLFDGFNKSRRKQNAEIALKNEQLRSEELQLQITSQIREIYVQYSDALSLIELEEENLQITQQSVEIALERFQLGTINSVEFREAQQNLLSAENRLIEAQIDAKSTETELLRLSGRLLFKD
ncbi:MAG: TolC family protein [Balneolaceae bacterium]